VTNNLDENHQNVTNNNIVTTENKIWLPPSFTNGKAPVILAPKEGGIKWGFADKSAWEWLVFLGTLLGALAGLAVPFVVYILGQQITQQQTQLSERQHQVDLQIAEDQQRATILQTYIDNIQDLLLNHNLLKSSSLNPSNPYYDVSTLARARTLTALQGLDSKRKARLLTFLYEADLISFEEGSNYKTLKTHLPIINLSDADLSGANISSDTFFCPQLSGVNLLGANLFRVNLYCAQLVRAELSITDLNGANLTRASLTSADLYDAELVGAHLIDADLSGAELSHAYLIDADLRGAHLECTDQFGEKRCADLSFAVLSGANLSGANLSGADLRYAYLTQQQLDQVSSCLNAILSPGLTCHHNQRNF
jgi:uncharacterized protein YjbI with pentapeptide repeats